MNNHDLMSFLLMMTIHLVDQPSVALDPSFLVRSLLRAKQTLQLLVLPLQSQ